MSLLFYLSKTLLLTCKNNKRNGFPMQDLQVQSNFSQTNTACFISFFEEHYHVFLAKDLIISKDDEIFKNENTYSFKEKVFMRTDNTFDFKINP